jgi:NAD(P)-dependent dehydrogenase (short-subunit alcohol dehydrogenase family)
MKVWFITGASSGFGQALADAVLHRGEAAIVAARRKSALDVVVAAYPERALAIALDVTDSGARERAVAAGLERFGRIDVLANIAGRGSLGAAEEFSTEQLRAQFEVNFFAAAELTRAVLPIMRSQRSGHILQLTSIGGLAGYQGFAPYCGSKFALEGWSESLRNEVRPLGIRVTIVEPGAFRTEFAGQTNMRPTQSVDDYRAIVDPVREYLYGSDGNQPGDPHKAAEAMIAVVESPEPPLRLMLGTDAIGLWEMKRAEIDADLQRWRAIGTTTSFDGATVDRVGGSLSRQ